MMSVTVSALFIFFVSALEKDAMRNKSVAYKKGSKRVEQNTVIAHCLIITLCIIPFDERC